MPPGEGTRGRRGSRRPCRISQRGEWGHPRCPLSTFQDQPPSNTPWAVVVGSWGHVHRARDRILLVESDCNLGPGGKNAIPPGNCRPLPGPPRGGVALRTCLAVPGPHPAAAELRGCRAHSRWATTSIRVHTATSASVGEGQEHGLRYVATCTLHPSWESSLETRGLGSPEGDVST